LALRLIRIGPSHEAFFVIFVSFVVDSVFEKQNRREPEPAAV
jgi:hypothetical protein